MVLHHHISEKSVRCGFTFVTINNVINLYNFLNQIPMANSNNRIITGQLKGALGKELVFREWAGKTIVSKYPRSRGKKPTPAQAHTHERFMLASRYAKAVMYGQDQGIRDAYMAALKPRQNLYCRATQDFLFQPVVKIIDAGHYNGATGDSITVRAIDDFRVTGVQVEIHTSDGILLEKGNAVQQLNGIDWTYTATQENHLIRSSKIRAIATDVPGNEGSLELML
jgi:hypothetical protein